jgi:LysR family transcriptional regulator, transcriptional activator for dmlA
MNLDRNQLPLPEDLRVFLTVIRKQSFAGAAEDLGVSAAYVSKRVNALEKALKTRLLHRTTRTMALTDDGERARHWALRILGDLDDFVDELSLAKQTPRGLVHICSSFGFGRHHVAPAISRLADKYPELEFRLEVIDRVVDMVSEGFDLEIRVGDDLPGQHLYKRLATNSRVLCAAPNYLGKNGIPTQLEDLKRHECLVLKERNNVFGVWSLESSGKGQDVHVAGSLSSNNGEIILKWGLDGRGIFLRSLWDVKPYLNSGELIRVLPDYSQSANVWALYPTRLSNSAKLRVCVESLEDHFKDLSL